jgi:hypothetical protein
MLISALYRLLYFNPFSFAASFSCSHSFLDTVLYFFLITDYVLYPIKGLVRLISDDRNAGN